MMPPPNMNTVWWRDGRGCTHDRESRRRDRTRSKEEESETRVEVAPLAAASATEKIKGAGERTGISPCGEIEKPEFAHTLYGT